MLLEKIGSPYPNCFTLVIEIAVICAGCDSAERSSMAEINIERFDGLYEELLSGLLVIVHV